MHIIIIPSVQTRPIATRLPLCLMQIGELVKHLSPDFVDSHTSIPWRAIRGMRNVVAHEYGNIDLETVWETSEAGIIELRNFCEAHIAADDIGMTML